MASTKDGALLQDFAHAVCDKLSQDLRQIARCCDLLSEEQAWARANGNCNSVANLLLHLNGNVRQWILGALAADTTRRDRPGEFAARGPGPVAPLLEQLTDTVHAACDTIRNVPSAAWATPRQIQGYEVSTLLAVFHVAEHFSFHCGQIVHMTKVLRDVDLSLYNEQGRRETSSRRPW